MLTLIDLFLGLVAHHMFDMTGVILHVPTSSNSDLSIEDDAVKKWLSCVTH